LEHGAGDGIVARQLRKAERDAELPETIGQLQMNTPPIVVRPRAKSVKKPVEGEM
jgi:hypothetical protein